MVSQALGKGFFQRMYEYGLDSKGMSNKTAIFIVALVAAGLYFFIWRPKRGK